MEEEILEKFDKCSVDVKELIRERGLFSKEFKEDMVTNIINLLKLVNDTDTFY